MNKIWLIGRIANDLELVTTNSGKTLCEFTLAVKKPVQKDETDFFRCIVWGKSAENLVNYQSKGQLIAVTGAVHIEKYEDNDGILRKNCKITVDNVVFLGKSQEKPKFGDLEIDEDLPF